MSEAKGTVISWLIIAAIVTTVWSWNTEWMYKNVRYSELKAEDVVVESRPIRCDFFAAPMGTKGCSVEKRVSESHDSNGKLTSVYIGWQLVAE